MNGEPSRAELYGFKNRAKTSLENFSNFVHKEISLKEPSFIHLVYKDGPKTLLLIGTSNIMQKFFTVKHKQVKMNPLYRGPCIQIQNGHRLTFSGC